MLKAAMIAFLPIAIRLIGYFIDRSVKDAEIKGRWLDFVLAMQAKGIISAKLRDDYQRQRDELDQLFKNEKPNSGS